MELGEAREVRTTCPYCGVGCGVLAKVGPGGGRIRPRGPAQAPHIRPGGAQGEGPGGPHNPARPGRGPP
ncbi:hypothetical protein NKI00_21105, partial [Mesorhizobium sp. M0847]|uniref:hypothetical protein n=1 Tax=Mesorhizobium sp. M0847 TaxID=2957011 RepID=UPI00333A1CEC